MGSAKGDGRASACARSVGSTDLNWGNGARLLTDRSAMFTARRAAIGQAKGRVLPEGS
jgi:hypothetical protein